ncbi:MAG: enoyl-CoA hydratase/isomerase family protein [Pseudomonadota bacterium]
MTEADQLNWTEETRAAYEESAGHVQFTREGAAGVITLTRPKALNALSLFMAMRISDALADWADDDDVKIVVIRAEPGARAFCAGGDIRALMSPYGQDPYWARMFFQREYAMNIRIRRFPKPYIALLDGVVMGGGCGLSVHGSHRLVGEKVMMAMPETAIGLFADVGASAFLPQKGLALGMYLAFTGARLDQADVLYAGFGTHAVSAEAFDDILSALAAAEYEGDAHAVVDAVLAPFIVETQASGLAERRALIDRTFDRGAPEAILEALESEDDPWAQDTAAHLRKMSPSSVKVTFRALREAAGESFEDIMRVDYRIATRRLEHPDFPEGVRAVIIDKTNAPVWSPARLEDVSDEAVDLHFAPLDEELRLPVL